jgi:hypothetical protein
MPDAIKRFSDFADEPRLLDGDKTKINNILNKEICVTGYKVRDSKHKSGTKCLTLQFEIDSKKYIVFTGSTVLIDQVEKYKDKIPFLAVIKQVDRFYSFS